jgi:hypothetical protein
MNNGTDYEKLTQEIYQDLLEKEGLTTEVKHNIRVKGKATTHQIDIYWEYKIAGVKHQVAIECKNYNKRISKSIIAAFHGILIDIGNTNGIIVTKVGFQRGAKEFADHYGINLIELREPRPEDWKGKLRVLSTHVHSIEFNVKNWYIDLDYDWCKLNFPEDLLNAIARGISITINNETWIYDEKGDKIKNFIHLQEELPFDESKLKDNKHIYKFENGFIANEIFGKIKINSVHVSYDTVIAKSHFVTDSFKITKAILKDVTSGEIKFIKKAY